MLPLINIFGSHVQTYFIFLGFVFSILVFYVFHRAKVEKVDGAIALNIGLVIMIAGFIGGRGFHVLYENPEIYREHWTWVFYFWTGGFVFYGGMIAALLGSVIYLRIITQPFWSWADFYAPVLALGYSMGRIGCFLAGCCFGKTCELPWAMHFPFDPNVGRHPTQLYASVMEFWIWFGLHQLKELNFYQRNPGALFLSYGALHATARLVMEHFRDDSRGPGVGPLSISSTISLLVLVVCGLLLLKKMRQTTRSSAK